MEAARRQAELSQEKAGLCEKLDFDAQGYLSDEKGYLKELKAAAERAGVKIYQRDGVLYCYPVLITCDAESLAIQINKKRIFDLEPSRVAETLKKEQAKSPRTKDIQFLEALHKAYEFIRLQKKGASNISVPLAKLYKVLTLLPGARKDYTQLISRGMFIFLDISGVRETNSGCGWEFTASTSSREHSGSTIKFVDRGGNEKTYHSIIFDSK